MENQTLSPIEKQQAIWDAEPPTADELKALRFVMDNIEMINFNTFSFSSLGIRYQLPDRRCRHLFTSF